MSPQTLQLPAEFDTALLDPQPPTAAENTCIGTRGDGTRCNKELSRAALQRAVDFVTSLRNTDPATIEREDLTMGEQGSVMDCFCLKHDAQVGPMVWAWLAQIEVVGKVRRREKRARNEERVEKWLEGVDAADGEGPAAEGEVEEIGEIGVGEGALSGGEGERK
ncbi:hypothetical protein PMIN04_002833 [Paraphaeosphaeria minitans]|uniref:Uncharacterized protein n=1 Tax=Paraphaeosphaeria minitans TaxID=565426 RepID=A0A9P6GCF2_9PLEO|nr:hypothetical protein PMIN01_09426 [Paraphaeosphaeria minitans]